MSRASDGDSRKIDSRPGKSSADLFEDLSSCLRVERALVIRDTSRARALDEQRAENYRSAKKLQIESRLLRFTELYGPEWHCRGLEKSRDRYKRKFIDSKLSDRSFVRL